MRTLPLTAVLSCLLFSGCGIGESTAERHHDANTPAGKLGQAAHRASVAAEKAGAVVGRQLKNAAHDAREGWKEDSRKTKGAQ